jgi:glycosyltransferase involved in cell wall biosynthesis
MGLENLLRAMAIVAKTRADVVLFIGGKGELAETLRQLSSELALDNVHLLGYIDDESLSGYYQASDLFVLPSEAMEGYGLSTLEAIACGVPVLGTATGGTPEILQDVLPGFIAKGVEPEALAEDILARLPLLAGVDGEHLRRFAAERSWAKVADRVEHAFGELVAERAACR